LPSFVAFFSAVLLAGIALLYPSASSDLLFGRFMLPGINIQSTEFSRKSRRSLHGLVGKRAAERVKLPLSKILTAGNPSQKWGTRFDVLR
jgi:hypothetical protein